MYTKIKTLINKNGFFKNILILITGAFIAQVFPIIITPFLTRLYSPTDFGVYAIFLSLVSILTVISTGRYELAIMAPDNDKDAINLSVLSVLVSLFLSLVSFIIILFFNNEIAGLLGEPKMSSYLYLLPILLILIGIYQSLNYWTNRQMRYRDLSFSRIINSVVLGSSNLITSSFGAFGLILGIFFGRIISLINLLYRFIKEDKRRFELISYKRIKFLAIKYKDYPQKSIVGAFLNILSSQLPVIILGNMFNSNIVGIYSLTMRVLYSPITLIGSNVSDVFFQQATKAARERELYPFVKKTVLMLTLVAILPTILLAIGGQEIFIVAFGEKWKEAGLIAQVMTPLFLIRFVVSSISTILMVKNDLGFEIKINLLLLASQILSLLIGNFIYKTYLPSFILMSIGGTLVYGYLGYHLLRLCRETSDEEDYKKNIDNII